MSGSPFWNFSLAVYGTPGVPDACIRLQDSSGVDVNMMLYLLWLAGQGRELDAGDVQTITSAIDGWKSDVVIPLRTARRTLKEPPSALAGLPVEALRNKVKAVELEAERLQQEALFSHAPPASIGRPSSDPRAAANANLAQYAKVLGSGFEEAARDQVIDAAMARVSGAGQ